MSFNMNQFALTNTPGLAMNPNPSTLSVRVSPNQAGNLVPGDVVSFDATAVGDLPVVLKTVSGNSGRGVVLFNPKKTTFASNDIMEIGMGSTIVTMAAATAINRGVNVAYNSVSGQVQSTSGNYIGQTIDIANVTGDIIRVHVTPLASAT